MTTFGTHTHTQFNKNYSITKEEILNRTNGGFGVYANIMNKWFNRLISIFGMINLNLFIRKIHYKNSLIPKSLLPSGEGTFSVIRNSYTAVKIHSLNQLIFHL